VPYGVGIAPGVTERVFLCLAATRRSHNHPVITARMPKMTARVNQGTTTIGFWPRSSPRIISATTQVSNTGPYQYSEDAPCLSGVPLLCLSGVWMLSGKGWSMSTAQYTTYR